MSHTCRSPHAPIFRLYLAFTLARVKAYEVSKPDGMQGQEPENTKLLGSLKILGSAFLIKIFYYGTLVLGGNSESVFALPQCFNFSPLFRLLVWEMFSAASMYLFVVHYSEYLITVWYTSFDGSVMFCQNGFENHFLRLPNKT